MRSFVTAALAGLAVAAPMTDIEFKFINFVAEHGKTYATKEEYAERLRLFSEMDKRIEEFNANETTSVHGHNKFSDWTDYERSKLTGTRQQIDPRSDEPEVSEFGATPDWTTGVNWVEAGDVSAVKDQGQCGSCWAFSSTGAVESIFHIAYKKTGAVAQISEQQLVDCVTTNDACNGGWPSNCFYYYESHGAYFEKDWPYTSGTTGRATSCTYNSNNASNVRVNSYAKVKKHDYVALQQAVATQPISVLIDAETYYFQTYKTGVLTNALQCGTTMDHAVLAVGYGQESGTDYFLVKNSWGTGWGDNGYVKIKASSANNGQGVCVIQWGPVYPIMH